MNKLKEKIMKTKHTQGNWRFEISSRGLNTYQLSTDEQVIGILETSQEVESVREAEANAKLIAAAPDLLEALNDVYNLANQDFITKMPLNVQFVFGAIQERSKEAIKKATS